MRMRQLNIGGFGGFTACDAARHDRRRLAYAVWFVLANRLLE